MRVQSGLHFFGFGDQLRVFFEVFFIRFAGTLKVIHNLLLFARLDNDTYLFDPGRDQVVNLVMHQRPGDSIRTDDGKELLFTGV